jgi:LuxR family maltose regulon positive regulatory protein
MSNQQLPRATDKYLDLNSGQDKLVEIGSKRWFAWLENEETRSFSFSGKHGHFTARKENKQRGTEYWYAYRWLDGKTVKSYLGVSKKLTSHKLNEVARKLTRQNNSKVSKHNALNTASGIVTGH